MLSRSPYAKECQLLNDLPPITYVKANPITKTSTEAESSTDSAHEVGAAATQSLEARIKQELEENPALNEGREKQEDNFENDSSDEREVRDSMEEINWDDYLRDDDVPEYRTRANNYSADDELYEAPVVVSESFHESLISQLRLRNLSEEDLE